MVYDEKRSYAVNTVVAFFYVINLIARRQVNKAFVSCRLCIKVLLH
jgi:hypothetical protein